MEKNVEREVVELISSPEYIVISDSDDDTLHACDHTNEKTFPEHSTSWQDDDVDSLSPDLFTPFNGNPTPTKNPLFCCPSQGSRHSIQACLDGESREKIFQHGKSIIRKEPSNVICRSQRSAPNEGLWTSTNYCSSKPKKPKKSKQTSLTDYYKMVEVITLDDCNELPGLEGLSIYDQDAKTVLDVIPGRHCNGNKTGNGVLCADKLFDLEVLHNDGQDAETVLCNTNRSFFRPSVIPNRIGNSDVELLTTCVVLPQNNQKKETVVSDTVPEVPGQHCAAVRSNLKSTTERVAPVEVVTLDDCDELPDLVLSISDQDAKTVLDVIPGRHCNGNKTGNGVLCPDKLSDLEVLHNGGRDAETVLCNTNCSFFRPVILNRIGNSDVELLTTCVVLPKNNQNTETVVSDPVPEFPGQHCASTANKTEDDVLCDALPDLEIVSVNYQNAKTVVSNAIQCQYNGGHCEDELPDLEICPINDGNAKTVGAISGQHCSFIVKNTVDSVLCNTVPDLEVISVNIPHSKPVAADVITRQNSKLIGGKTGNSMHFEDDLPVLEIFSNDFQLQHSTTKSFNSNVIPTKHFAFPKGTETNTEYELPDLEILNSDCVTKTVILNIIPRQHTAIPNNVEISQRSANETFGQLFKDSKSEMEPTGQTIESFSRATSLAVESDFNESPEASKSKPTKQLTENFYCPSNALLKNMVSDDDDSDLPDLDSVMVHVSVQSSNICTWKQIARDNFVEDRNSLECNGKRKSSTDDLGLSISHKVPKLEPSDARDTPDVKSVLQNIKPEPDVCNLETGVIQNQIKITVFKRLKDKSRSNPLIKEKNMIPVFGLDDDNLELPDLEVIPCDSEMSRSGNKNSTVQLKNCNFQIKTVQLKEQSTVKQTEYTEVAASESGMSRTCGKVKLQRTGERTFVDLEKDVQMNQLSFHENKKIQQNDSLPLSDKERTEGTCKAQKIKLKLNTPDIIRQPWIEQNCSLLKKNPSCEQFLEMAKMCLKEGTEEEGNEELLRMGLRQLKAYTTCASHPPVELIPMLLTFLRTNRNVKSTYETLLHLNRFDGINKEIDWWKEIQDSMDALKLKNGYVKSKMASIGNILALQYIVIILAADIEKLYIVPGVFTLKRALAYKFLCDALGTTARACTLAEWFALACKTQHSEILQQSPSLVNILSDLLTMAVMVSKSPFVVAAEAGQKLYLHYKEMPTHIREGFLRDLNCSLVRYKTLQLFLVRDFGFAVYNVFATYPVTLGTLLDPSQYSGSERDLEEMMMVMKFILTDYCSCARGELHLPLHNQGPTDLPPSECEILSNLDKVLDTLEKHLRTLYSTESCNSVKCQSAFWQLRLLNATTF